MSGADLDGLRFRLPSAAVAVHDRDRLAVALLTGGAVRYGEDLLAFDLACGAADFGPVRTGRCPLLAEHLLTLDTLLGRVLTAEVEGRLLRCLVEFSRGEQQDRLLGLIRDGFPLNLSLGATVQHAEHVEGRCYRAAAWRLAEISVVPIGKDEDAYLRELGVDDDVAAMVRRMHPPGDDAGRLAARRALRLDRWQAWARALTAELGRDVDLEERVAAHCAELERDFRP